MKKLMTIASVAIMGLLPFSAAYAAGIGAQTACDGAGGATAVPGSNATFVVNQFTPVCSKNVNLSYEQGAIAVAVGSNSIKGKNSFQGNSLGGAVAVTVGCATNCTLTEAQTARTAVIAAASL